VRLRWQVERPLEQSKPLSLIAFALLFLLFLPGLTSAQNTSSESPVPVLTGSVGYFTNIERGDKELAPEINPVLLVPFGDRWLVEARAGFEGEFERENDNGPYKGVIGKEVDLPATRLYRQPSPNDHNGQIFDSVWYLQRAVVSHLDPQFA